MVERIGKLAVAVLALSHLLLLSCSSSITPGTVRNPPAAPTHVGLVIVPQGLEITWQPVSGATHYTVFWGSNREDYRGLVNCDRSALVLRGLKNEKLYFFAVTAWNPRGESGFSGEQALVYDDGSARPEIYLAEGKDLMNKGEYMAASAYFSAAIRLDPRNLRAYQNRALLQEKIHRPDLARQDRATAEKLFREQRITLR